ncbi:MAG: sugar transferase [Rhizobiales bacterium]|nr:sugar transferase [Hyphomicrobiales bacterium]
MFYVSNAIAGRIAAGTGFRTSLEALYPQKPTDSLYKDRSKRLFDMVAASLLLIFLLPVMILIAMAIRLTSSGPALFRQVRYGRHKVGFEILKFRTMRVMEPGENFCQACRNDPRVTPLGAFLRRTSLDELPQLWNVVRGDMSLVGPRPHATSMDDAFAKRIKGYDRRFLMRPGITGLAQCTGYRGATNTMTLMIGRVCRDVYYVRNQSMALDLRILAMTMVSLLTDDAY